MLTQPEKQSRNLIEAKDVKHWSKHLNVTPDELSIIIKKIGNSVAAVQNESKHTPAKP